MSGRGGAALYTPEILALAVDLAAFPLDDDLLLRGEAVSRVCGSRITVGVEADEAGAISRIGARVTACAIGQAAAALFLRGADGCDHLQIARAQAQLDVWLSDSGPLPDWPGMALLEPARAYPARHTAMLLPWKAAGAALSNPRGAA
jgi:NifU-like protein involved in Fe-S cluster formation